MNTKSIEERIDMLGMKVQDKVTGFEGVVATVTFDLYGCIQGWVTPVVGKEGKLEKGYWFDVARLKITSKERAMQVPDFDKGYVAEGRKGPAAKSAPRQ